jgi:hypothetical protein
MIFLLPILLFLAAAFLSSSTGKRLLQRLLRRDRGREPAGRQRREANEPRIILPGWGSLPSANGQDPQARLFRLASRRRGRLTVSDVVIDLGVSVHEAEDLLDAMVDGRRVRMQVGPNGLAVYEFPEILARRRRP